MRKGEIQIFLFIILLECKILFSCFTLIKNEIHFVSLNNADVFIMGDDWKDKFDEFNDICKVIYLPRTPSISTTELVEIIKQDIK